MASAGLGEELQCSICLNLYTDPVTLRCEHNFCWVCIHHHLSTQDESGVYSCPECREEFQDRPQLHRNITLCNIVENFLSTQPHEEEIEIFCTYCMDVPVPAVKSCLLCEASLCDKHLRVHSKSAQHVLTDPSTSLENYCTEDPSCSCVSCSLTEEHQLEMLDEASEKKKKKLKYVLQKLTTKREETEERVQGLEEHRRKAQEKASGEVERVTALFIDIRRWLDNLEKGVLSEISRQEKKVSLLLSDVIERLEIKKDELSRRIIQIEELCNVTDPLTVLQDPDTGDLCDTEEEGGDEDTGGHDGGDRGAELISNLSSTLSDIIRGVNVTFYVQDPTDILLDVNAAANNILISDDLKTASQTDITQSRPETAERFQHNQVISNGRFTSGRHYWDVEIRRSRLWRVGMCYPSIDRRGHRSFIGYNNKSWGLCGAQFNNQCSVVHDKKEIQLPHQISSDRFRIYVDYEAGQLSFYELCDPIRHLHTFTATFTEPLHAVVCVLRGYIKVSGEGSGCKESPSEEIFPETSDITGSRI